MPRWICKTDKDYHILAESRGIEWVGHLPNKVEELTKWKCACSNIFETSYKRVNDGSIRCFDCTQGRSRVATEYHCLAFKRGIEWVGKITPENTKTKTLWKCQEGHTWEATYASVYRSIHGCRKCFSSKYSGENSTNWNGGGGRAGAAHRRRAREALAVYEFTESDWIRALNYWGGHCAYCGTSQGLFKQNTITRDHYLPLDLGGAYTPDNIIPACLSCNSSKRNRLASDWLVEKFGNRRAIEIQKAIQDYFNIILPTMILPTLQELAEVSN